jgi:pimeloyl-ACP methyl ester carboxylesterase
MALHALNSVLSDIGEDPDPNPPPLALHIVGHSMGGAVAILLSQLVRSPPRELRFRCHTLAVASLTLLEGNVLPSDCSLISRRFADPALTPETAVSIFDGLLSDWRDIAAAGSASFASYFASAVRWPAQTYAAAAASLVAHCDSQRLQSIVIGLCEASVPVCYAYGGLSRAGTSEVVRFFETLQTAHQQTSIVALSTCGHFLPTEAPISVCEVLLRHSGALNRL